MEPGPDVIGVVLFPGTNCEQDVVEAIGHLGAPADIVWHGDRRLPSGVDAVVLPGGFAHGDYLRTGAIARFSPVMAAVADFAEAGGPVLGICNGFQILCEAGLLPGALQKNAGLKFVCARSPTCASRHRSLRCTSNSRQGDGVADSDQSLRGLLHVRRRRRWPSCGTTSGSSSATSTIPMARSTTSPGCARSGRNVVGLMPHPERATHEILGSTDGGAVLAQPAGGGPLGHSSG